MNRSARLDFLIPLSGTLQLLHTPTLSLSPRRILPVACQVIMFPPCRKSEIAVLTEASNRLSSYVASDHGSDFARSGDGERHSRFHLTLFLNRTVSVNRSDEPLSSCTKEHHATVSPCRQWRPTWHWRGLFAFTLHIPDQSDYPVLFSHQGFCRIEGRYGKTTWEGS